MAPPEPISPELVLVCPELREALHATKGATEAAEPVRASGVEAGVEAVPLDARLETAPGPTGWAAIVSAAAIYAASRVVSTAIEAALIIAVLVVMIVAATQVFHL